MAKKTNKTSHVLNLITNGASADTEADASDSGQPEQSGPEAAPEPVKQTFGAQIKNGGDSASADTGGIAGAAIDASLEAAEIASAEIALGGMSGVSGRDAAAVLKDTAAALKDTAAVLKDSSASLKEKEAELKGNSEALKEKEAALKDNGESGEEADTVPEDNTVSSEEKKIAPKDDNVTTASPDEKEAASKAGATLLSGPPPSPSEDSGNAAREAGPKPSPIGDRKVIVVNETSENDKISNEILNRLTDQLEQEKKEKEKVDTYRMVNVMEQLLKRQDLKKYMEQYDVCMCSRCRADVLALILTRLPAKYVVVDSSSVAPIIGYYEGKFKIRILTEIIKSCMDVKESPRHGQAGEF